MKFSIDKTLLLENLLNVSKAVSNKNIIPILSGIKFELNKEGLNLMASDGELTIKTVIFAKKIKFQEGKGIFIIQSKYIIDIIRKMPSNVINFELIDSLKIKIYSENNYYNLNCYDSKDYPDLKIEEQKNFFNVSSSLLKKMITQTAFAISIQELRPILTGINFKINKNKIDCTATDSYRIAKKNMEINETSETVADLIIPGKNLVELDKILLDNEELVQIHIFNNKVLFIFMNIYFQTNLLNGNYPNMDNLFKSDYEHIISLNLKEFYDAIDRAALLTQNKDKKLVKLKLVQDYLKIESFSSEIGNVEEKIKIDYKTKKEVEISFSSKYMLEALKTFEEEQILILFNTDIKPIVIKSINDESLIQLILPIKTY